MIDSLTSLKLNALHLHPTDSQSFPIVLDSVKNLTHAAYGPKAVCMKEDLRKLSELGKRRGILVVPEIDTPAHTQGPGGTLEAIWLLTAGSTFSLSLSMATVSTTSSPQSYT